jgi:hypothetical protein
MRGKKMCELVCIDEEEVLKCPARRAVYLSERPTRQKIEFVDRQFLLDLGYVPSQALGVLIDGDLYLIHTVTHIDQRRKRGQRYSCVHFVRKSMDLPDGHYYFFAPPGCGQRLLRIPSQDILSKCFDGGSRDKLTVSMPWEDSRYALLPFEKYEIPLVTSIEV